MPTEEPSKLREPEWSIGYGRFFASKIRRKLATWAELPLPDRPFRLFCTTNDVISTHIRAGGMYEPEVLGMIRAIAVRLGLRDGIGLDIGANIGNHSVWMASLFSQVVAFEPSKVMSTVLRANALLNRCNNLRIVEAALSNHHGTANLTNRRTDHIGTIELDESPEAGDDLNSDTIALVRGDQVLSELLLTSHPVSFIKIDVEGSEVAALDGLSETLRRHHPVICFEARNRIEGDAVRSILTSNGYTHFYAIQASRLGLKGLALSLHRPDLRLKRYRLARLTHFEDRHYAAVFAWHRDLT